MQRINHWKCQINEIVKYSIELILARWYIWCIDASKSIAKNIGESIGESIARSIAKSIGESIGNTFLKEVLVEVYWQYFLKKYN